MRYGIILLLWCICTTHTLAQSGSPTMEIGSEIISWNYLHKTSYYSNVRRLHAFSGVFLRYNLRKVSFRANLHYKSTIEMLPNVHCPNCLRGNYYHHFFSAGLGVQRRLTYDGRLYAFGDVRFLYLQSSGNGNGRWTGITLLSLLEKQQSIVLSTGIGAKTHLYKRLYLQLEAMMEGGGRNATYQAIDARTTSEYTGVSKFLVLLPASRLLLTMRL